MRYPEDGITKAQGHYRFAWVFYMITAVLRKNCVSRCCDQLEECDIAEV